MGLPLSPRRRHPRRQRPAEPFPAAGREPAAAPGRYTRATVTPTAALAIADVWAAVRCSPTRPRACRSTSTARPGTGASASTCGKLVDLLERPAPGTTQADLVSSLMAHVRPRQRLPREVPPGRRDRPARAPPPRSRAARARGRAAALPLHARPPGRSSAHRGRPRPRQGPVRRRPDRPLRRPAGRSRARPLRRARQARALATSTPAPRAAPRGPPACCGSARAHHSPTRSGPRRSSGPRPASRRPGDRGRRRIPRRSPRARRRAVRRAAPPRRPGDRAGVPHPAAHARRADRRLAHVQHGRAGVDRLRPLLAHALAAPDRARDLQRPPTSPSSASSSTSSSTACCAPTPRPAPRSTRWPRPDHRLDDPDEVRRLEDLPGAAPAAEQMPAATTRNQRRPRRWARMAKKQTDSRAG